jgi:hypothetical protein
MAGKMKPHIYWHKRLRSSGIKIPNESLKNVELAKCVYWFRNKSEKKFTKKDANNYLKRSMYKDINE